MSSFVKALPSLSVIAIVCVLASTPGCGMGDPQCECSVDSIEFPVVRSVEDTLTARFTVRNIGDADRLAFTIPEIERVGLTIDEPRVYVLDEGASTEYTLRYAPQDSVTAEEIMFRVGPGEDCVIRVNLLGAGSPRPIGSCCFDDGSCEQGLVEGECSDLDGRFNGVGTTCEDAVCRGACCLVTGDCAQDTVSINGGQVIQPLTAADCTTLGGTYQGDGSLCADTICPQPTPSCSIDPTSFDFTFTLADLIGGGAKTDTLVVTNTGLAPLTALRAPVALCSGSITWTVLTNAGDEGQFFAIPPGESALVEVAASPGSFDCEFALDTNAGTDGSCSLVTVNGVLDLGTLREARRK